jgi:aspartate 1-decarboxylase
VRHRRRPAGRRRHARVREDRALQRQQRQRFSTYIIKAARGSGAISLNGAAARKAHVGDLLIISTYANMSEEAAARWKPRVVLLGEGNRINQIKKSI